MDKIKAFLKRKIGPFPVGVWLLIIVGGTVVGLILRARSTGQGNQSEGIGVGVGGPDTLPALHDSNGAIGVPYPYAEQDYPTDFERFLGLLEDSYYGGYPAYQESYQSNLYYEPYQSNQDNQFDSLAEVDSGPALDGSENVVRQTTTTKATTSSPVSSPTVALDPVTACEQSGGVMFRGECLTRSEYEKRLRALQVQAAEERRQQYTIGTVYDPEPTGMEASATDRLRTRIIGGETVNIGASGLTGDRKTII